MKTLTPVQGEPRPREHDTRTRRIAAWVASVSLAAVGTGAAFVASQSLQPAHAQTREVLAPVSAFDKLEDPQKRSVALFQEAGKVITHPRCLNCHPKDDTPRQGEDMHVHEPPVQRGAGGMGASGMRCFTCHGKANYDPGGIPGHERWLLAPIEMAWIGRPLGAICEQLKDPKRNGGKSLEQIVEHMAHDSLVGWGWEPGASREPAPGTQAEFGALIAAWVKSGAHCPKS